MSSQNERTIQAYEAHVDDYGQGILTEVSGSMKNWLDEAVAPFSADARMLEIGSGNGRDALYLKKKGYTVECTDAAEGFVELLRKRGLHARVLNVVTDDLDGPYDFILANAVLIHFTRDEAVEVIRKVLAALKPGGVFAFSLIESDKDPAWTAAQDRLGTSRFFYYWTEEKIRATLANFELSKLHLHRESWQENASWLHITVRR